MSLKLWPKWLALLQRREMDIVSQSSVYTNWIKSGGQYHWCSECIETRRFVA